MKKPDNYEFIIILSMTSLLFMMMTVVLIARLIQIH